MQKFKNAEQVVNSLKSYATSLENDLRKVRGKFRKVNVSIPYAELNYRTIGGPYKVKIECFESSSGKFWFDPIAMHATSYGWWSMLCVHKGKIVRNACGYSMQTSKHQDMLDKAIKALGIKVDVTIATKANIGNLDTLKDTLLSEHCDRAMLSKYSRKGHYKGWVRASKRELDKCIKAGLFKVTTKDMQQAMERAEQRRRAKLDSLKKRRQWQKEREQERAKRTVNAFDGFVRSDVASDQGIQSTAPKSSHLSIVKE